MNQKNITVILVLVLVVVAGFYAFNGYIYKEKQEPNPAGPNPSGPTANEPTVKAPIVGENLDGEADPKRMKLDMKEWIWLLNEKFTITFGADGKFSVKTDCNSMGGSYSTVPAGDGTGTMTFSQIFSTKMYCEGSVESDFASMLEKVSGYRFTGRGHMILDLKSDAGTVVFR